MWLVQAPKPLPPAEKAPKKTIAKVAETKGKTTTKVAREEPLDPVAEKLHQQRLIIILLCWLFYCGIFPNSGKFELY